MAAIDDERLNIPEWARENDVVRFFYIFSRFEYALKRARYLKKNTNAEPRWAEPAWDDFAEKVGDIFFQKIKSCESRILISQPPKRQVICNNELSWEDENVPSTCKGLFLAIRRVRNNLFHGGKYPIGPIDEPSRNRDLIRACLNVLEKALEEDSEVRRWFINEME